MHASGILDSHTQTEDATVAGFTEARTEWYTGANPDALLTIACPRDGELGYGGMARRSLLSASAYRRLQHFGCACARMTWAILPVDSQSAIRIRERYANDQASESDLHACSVRMPHLGGVAVQAHSLASVAHAVGDVLRGPSNLNLIVKWCPTEAARSAAKALATRAAGPVPPGRSPDAVEWHAKWNAAFAAARAHQAELVRDIFPPPGYTPAVERDWLTDTVRALARHADNAGEYDVLPILADALQDAGCEDEFILNRCRAESGIHARGNWVVDSLLGAD